MSTNLHTLRALVVDAFAGVLDANADLILGRRHDDGDGAVRRGVAERVRDEVQEDALDLLGGEAGGRVDRAE